MKNGLMQYTILALVVCGIIITLAGFWGALKYPEVTTRDVYQYIDHDARVVCYILKNGNGISCLPLGEVNISE